MDYKSVDNEKEYLLYIELPNIINRIISLAGGPHSCLDYIEDTEKYIKKVVGYQLMKSKETTLLINQISDDTCNNR